MSDKTQEIIARLEAGLQAIADSDGFRRYLEVQARFRQYSWANTVLILTQRPDATRVAGYRTWQQLGRQVRRGEKGIMIRVPFFRPKEERDDPDEPPVWYGVGYVFDISQTDGDPLPEPPRPQVLDGGSADLVTRLIAAARTLGVRDIRVEPLPEGTQGVYHPVTRRIVLRENPPAQQAKTLIHELAHHLTYRPGQDYRVGETIAESVAYLVSAELGMDTGAYSFPYVAVCAGRTSVLREVLGTVQSVSRQIMDALGLPGTAAGRYHDSEEGPCTNTSLDSSTIPSAAPGHRGASTSTGGNATSS